MEEAYNPSVDLFTLASYYLEDPIKILLFVFKSAPPYLSELLSIHAPEITMRSISKLMLSIQRN